MSNRWATDEQQMRSVVLPVLMGIQASESNCATSQQDESTKHWFVLSSAPSAINHAVAYHSQPESPTSSVGCPTCGREHWALGQVTCGPLVGYTIMEAYCDTFFWFGHVNVQQITIKQRTKNEHITNTWRTNKQQISHRWATDERATAERQISK